MSCFVWTPGTEATAIATANGDPNKIPKRPKADYSARACVILHAEPLSISGKRSTWGSRREGQRMWCLRPVELEVGKESNVSMDYFFTPLSLVNKLFTKKTSLSGTMNKVRRELPPSAQNKAPAQP
jgi:hypothetical protein